jgi:23S rRNA (cytosine1962-C5)-methyltransferase
VLACSNDPATGPDFLIDGVTREAPGLAFKQRLANPPEFPDVDSQCGLKALVFTAVTPATRKAVDPATRE